MSKNKAKKWTEEEIAYLKENYYNTSNNEISIKLDRDASSLAHKAKRLGLKKFKNTWSSEELSILINNYKKTTKNEIMELIPKKSHQAIKQKAYQLGIRKHKKWTTEEDEFIKKNYGKISFNEIGVKLNRTEATISNRAQLLGVSKQLYKINDDQKKIIEELYADNSLEHISKQTKVPKESIRHYAQRNGLKKTMWWTEEEINIVKKYYGTSNHYMVKELLPRRSIKSISKKAYELGAHFDEDIMFDVRNKNLKGRLDCNTIDNPNFNNDKGIRYACRNRISTWRKNIVKAQKICQLTGASENLVVHHLKSFRDIYYDVLKEFESYGFIVDNDIKQCAEINGKEKLDLFLKRIAESHKPEYGILITTDIHDEFHTIYGTRNCNEEQFYEFAKKYYNIDVKEKLNLK